MEQSALKAFSEHLSLGIILEALFVLLAAWVAVRLLKVVLDRLAEKFKKYRMEISRLFPILRLGLWSFTIGFIVFGILNPSENVVLALGASAGIAVGLAAQDMMRNVMAGIMMMFDRPFQVGDMVQVGPHYGEVISLNLNSVRLRTFQDDVVTIPSAEVLKQGVSNSNAGELTEMISIPFTLPGTVDVHEVKRLAWEAAASSPYTYLKKPIIVGVEDRFEHTFLTRVTVKVYVVDVRLERLLATDVTLRVKKELIARGLLTEEMVAKTVAATGA